MVGHRARSAKFLLRALAIVMPVLLVPTLTSLGVGYLARRGAAVLGKLASGVPAPAFAFAGTFDPMPIDLDLSANGSDAISSVRQSAAIVTEPRQRSGPHKTAVAARRGARRIFVGPELIRRAVPASGRPSASWTNRTDDHPAGMVISNPGALAGTIQAGDIIFEAEGRSLASFEQLVAIVGQAYQNRAKIVSGRMWRRGEPWTITVEPGWTFGARE